MAKQLTQITFDFSIPEEPVKEETPVVEEPAVTLVKEEPLPIEIPEEEKAGVKVIVKLKEKKKSTRGRKSLKDIEIGADLIQIPPDDILFQKQYYSIGDVARMFRENQSLIRYWETEFDILQPRKNRKGDRFFRPVDIKNLVMIYDLLRRRKFTIEGAKDYLKKNKKAEEKFAMIQSLQKIKDFLLELKANL
ncbi:MAG: MerR family transcriptional regulator [Chitinophagaceae bacterium]|nr:MerR family transcriptional regulator [Chitinophagaceae bacterium]